MNRQASPHVLQDAVHAFASQGSAAPSVWLVVVEHASPPRPFPLPFDSHLAPIIALSQPGKQRMIYYSNIESYMKDTDRRASYALPLLRRNQF